MRTSTPQALAAAPRIPIGPVCDLEPHPRREAGLGAPGLSAPPAAPAAGGSSSLAAGHGGPQAHSPGMTPVCAPSSHFLTDRGVPPEGAPEAGVESSDPAPSRFNQVGACVCIPLVLAAALFDAPFWLGRAFVALGWV